LVKGETAWFFNHAGLAPHTQDETDPISPAGRQRLTGEKE
jgi:hypothetical protein